MQAHRLRELPEDTFDTPRRLCMHHISSCTCRLIRERSNESSLLGLQHALEDAAEFLGAVWVGGGG